MSFYLTGHKLMQCKATLQQFCSVYYGGSSTAERHNLQMYQEKKGTVIHACKDPSQEEGNVS